MKLISDLIKELEKAKDEHGDLEVRCYPYDGLLYSCSPILEIWTESYAPDEGREKTLEIDGI